MKKSKLILDFVESIDYERDKTPDEVFIDDSYEVLTSIELGKLNKHKLSEFTYKCMLLVEGIITKTKYYEKDSLKRLYTVIHDFVKVNRSSPSVSQSQKLIMWILKCRIYVILYIGEKMGLSEGGYLGDSEKYSDYGDYEQLKVLNQFGLFVSKAPICSYNLRTYWRTIQLLVSKIHTVPYSETLREFVHALRLRCGAFICSTFSDSKILNDPLFTTTNGGVWSVSRTFVRETERVFFELDLMFDFRDRFKYNNKKIEFDPTIYANFSSWIEDFTSGTYAEFIEKKLRMAIYECFVYITEEDRFKEEVEMVDPTPYNILAKYKRSVFNNIGTKYIESPIEVIKKEHAKNIENNNHKWLIDRPFELLCRICITFWFSASYSDQPFDDYFKDQTTYTSNSDNMNYIFPLIVRIFNQFAVVYKGEAFVCNDFDTCFLYWVYIACTDKTINGKLPTGKGNMTKLFKSFFKEEDDQIKKLEKMHQTRKTKFAHLSAVPPVYRTDGNAFL